MPMVSTEAIDAQRAMVRKLRQEAKGGGLSATKNKRKYLMAVGEVAGGAALAGYLRGKAEASNREFKLFGIDGELLIGLGLLSLPFLPLPKKLPIPKNDAVNVGVGVLAHYAGSVARKAGAAKAGEAMSYIAGAGWGGSEPDLVGRQGQFTLPHSPSYVGSDIDALYRTTTF